MDYPLYTFGGGEGIFRVFSALAMLFKSDSVYMTAMLKFSLTIGALWAALTAIYRANIGLFARDWFLPTYAILSLLLIPKATVHVVDVVNPHARYHKIDHIPAGIALVASVTSTLSKGLTERLEAVLEPVESLRSGVTGPLFGARLVALARDIRIHDPIVRDDLKQFVHQCFTLPFVWTHIGVKGQEARQSTDLLETIQQKGHPALGSYWRQDGKHSVFLVCRDGARHARKLLQAEIPEGLREWAHNLFGAAGETASLGDTPASQRLRQYAGSAWHHLAGHTTALHQVVGQQMMMNVYREALDDLKQKYGMDRVHPELIAASATRARAQQNNSFLISAQAMAGLLPSLQSTLVALFSLLFVLILPLAFLPGGLKTLGTWVKLLMWVESWPLFFAVINGVTQNIMAFRSTTWVKTGAGLSLATQNGLADAAWDAWCYGEGLMALVPAFSWAILSGGGYALANLSGSVLRTMDGISGKLGSEAVDGNLSVDQQALHGRSIATTQMAQQQLGASYQFGQTVSDGHLAATYTPQGRAVFQENQSNLGTHVLSTENLAASLTETGSRAWNTAHQQSVQASQSFQQGMNELYSYATQYSQSQSFQERFGQGYESGEGKDWRKTLDTAHKFAQDNKISDEKAFQVLAKAGANTGLLKAIGIDIGFESNSSIRSGETELFDKAKSSGLSEQFSQSLSNAFKKSTGTDGSLSDQAQKNTQESIQGHFQKASQYQDQAQANYSEAENYSKAASFVESQGGTITTNLDSEVLSHIAQKRGMSEAQVAQWQMSHKSEFAAEASAFLAHKLQPFLNSLKSSSPLSAGDIQEKAAEFFGAVPNTINHADQESARAKATQEGLNPHQGWTTLAQKTDHLKHKTQEGLNAQTGRLTAAEKNVQGEYQGLSDHYADRKEDGVLIGGLKNLANQVPLVNSVGQEALRPEEINADSSNYLQSLNDDVVQHQTRNKMMTQARDLARDLGDLREAMNDLKNKSSDDDILHLRPSTKVER